MAMNLLKSFARRLRRAFAHPSRYARGAKSRADRFRPSVLVLEDRTVPSGADLFSEAAVLGGTSATDTGSNVGATAESGEQPLLPGLIVHSVWWQWTAPADGPVEVNTFGSDFDT